jgi:hypothetical protein
MLMVSASVKVSGLKDRRLTFLFSPLQLKGLHNLRRRAGLVAGSEARKMTLLVGPLGPSLAKRIHSTTIRN